jgi:hypothetical protein
VPGYETLPQLAHYAERVEWMRRGTQPAVDASGETDWGHIDVYRYEGRLHELEGDWGAVRILGDPPSLVPQAAA